MLINIFFALVALGAMCIDIILNRGLLDELNDEAEEQKGELSKFLGLGEIPDRVKERIKGILDTVDTLTERLKIKVQKGCASRNARPFYVVIIIASIAVIISALVDYCHGKCDFNACRWFPAFLYLTLCTILNFCWVVLFIFLIKKLYLIYDFNKIVESERSKIRKIVQDTKYSIITLFPGR